MKLIIEDDEGKTTTVPWGERELTVGRHEGNALRLMERNVSRRHARLFAAAGRLIIEDLDSYNGVFLNGERVLGRAELALGDQVEIGDYRIGLRPDDPDDAEEDTFDVPVAEAAGGLGSEDATSPTPAWDPTTEETPVEPVGASEASGSAASVDAPPAEVEPDAAPAVEPDAPSAAAPRGLVAVRPEPRLVCVSTEFAGLDFALGRDNVIGRVEECSIIIEHPSVSRTHARVVARDGVFEVQDLESANGVLVNGDFTRRAVLRAHDVIELGHVRLRFLPGGVPLQPTVEDLAALRATGFEIYEADDPSRAVTVTDEPPPPPPPRRPLDPQLQTARTRGGLRPPPEPAPRRFPWLPVAGAALVAGVGVAYWLMTAAREPDWDRRLQLQVQAGRLEEALATYEAHRTEFRDRSAASERYDVARERFVQSLLRDANRAIETSDVAGAISLMERCLAVDPRAPACHWSIGVAYARADRADAAARHYRRFVELAPDDERVPAVLDVLRAYEAGESGGEDRP